jgi:hypothetical protein
MIDQPSHQGSGPPRKFVPELKSLESRFLLSAAVPQRDSIIWFPDPPRTGGLAIQTGSILNCVAGNPRRNSVQVIDDGRGHVEMSWNFGKPQAFTGVTTTIIQAQRARTDQFTFHFSHGDTVTAVAELAGPTFQEPGPSSASTAIELGTHRATHSRDANVEVHALAHVQFVRGGLAVQSGSELTIIVRRPSTNVVQITDVGAGNVQVEWNGGRIHSFTDVATVVVDTRNARRDQVTLHD